MIISFEYFFLNRQSAEKKSPLLVFVVFLLLKILPQYRFWNFGYTRDALIALVI